MTAKQGILRSGATVGILMLLYVGSYGPLLARLDQGALYWPMPLQLERGRLPLYLVKGSNPPVYGDDVWFSKFYAPIDQLRELPDVDRAFRAYTNFCERVMYGERPAYTWPQSGSTPVRRSLP